MPEAVWFESGGDLQLLQGCVVGGFGFRRRDVADRLQEPAVVEPVDPFEGGQLDGLERAPRAFAPDDLGLVEAVDGLVAGVFVAAGAEITDGYGMHDMWPGFAAADRQSEVEQALRQRVAEAGGVRFNVVHTQTQQLVERGMRRDEVRKRVRSMLDRLGLGARLEALDGAAAAEKLLRATFRAGEPGASALVARNGRVIFRGNYGIANRQTKEPITSDTVFDTGSVSKAFTAAAVLLLAEEGKLATSDLATKYLPELAGYKTKLKALRGLPANVRTALECTPASAHPMDVMRTGISVLGTVL